MRLTRSVAIAVALAALVASKTALPQTEASIVNRIEVQLLEVGYPLDGGPLKTRVTLVTGQALEHTTGEAGEADALIRMADALASGHARMFAEVQGSRLRGIQLAVGRGAR
jgi:hypothetical protein